MHAAFDGDTVRGGLGEPEYSYHFILSGFLPALRQLGTVTRLRDPARQADSIYDSCRAKGEDCVFLCFAPPHLVPITLRCPTIPVFTWSFTTLPCEPWSDDPRSDWRVVFRHCGRAITLSRHTAALVKQAMGPDFPVHAIPTASYDAFAPLFQLKAGARKPREIRFRGALFDSAAEERFRATPAWTPPSPPPPPPLSPRMRLGLSLGYALSWYRDVVRDLLPAPVKAAMSRSGGLAFRAYRRLLPVPAPAAAPPPPAVPACVQLSDIVYTAVLAPQDGRKNWHELLTAFIWAFRDEKRATLVLKMPLSAWNILHADFLDVMTRFAPFSCRVVMIYGYLEAAEYAALAGAADLYVNASTGEGLCMPLLEFLSAGVPAIAPDHTAMADYITPALGFPLRASLEHNIWPFDPREMFSTMRYRLHWDSLEAAFRASFDIALSHGGAYARMAQAAHEAMREYCGAAPVRDLLAEALGIAAAVPAMPASAAAREMAA